MASDCWDKFSIVFFVLLCEVLIFNSYFTTMSYFAEVLRNTWLMEMTWLINSYVPRSLLSSMTVQSRQITLLHVFPLSLSTSPCSFVNQADGYWSKLSLLQVLEMESLFLMPDILRIDLACLLKDVQEAEKQKLHLVNGL